VIIIGAFLKEVIIFTAFLKEVIIFTAFLKRGYNLSPLHRRFCGKERVTYNSRRISTEQQKNNKHQNAYVKHSLGGQWRSFATMTAISTNIEAWVLAEDML
jgi:hypothetical protein